MAGDVEKGVVDVAPQLKTGALSLNLGNIFSAIGRTPIGKEYPLPTIGRVVATDAVELRKGRRIKVTDPQTEMEPGKRVIIYKQAISEGE